LTETLTPPHEWIPVKILSVLATIKGRAAFAISRGIAERCGLLRALSLSFHDSVLNV
jgi:hypothetical protein